MELIPYPTPTTNVRQGQMGDRVRWVQWMLQALGYSVGTGGVSGRFDASTENAVRLFQRGQNLIQDGIVGPYTRSALLAEFGRRRMEIPGPYQTGRIVDVSQYQGIIDWETAAPELDFAIIRTQVGTTLDSLFALNVASAQANDIPFGVYAYLRAGTEEAAREEARLFFNRARYAYPIFYVVDVEQDISEDMPSVVSAFIQELRLLGANKIGIYVAHHLYEQLDLDLEQADFIWLPRYGRNLGFYDIPPDYPADLHQYTDRGSLPGVDGFVDLNRLTGTIPLEWFTNY